MTHEPNKPLPPPPADVAASTPTTDHGPNLSSEGGGVSSDAAGSPAPADGSPAGQATPTPPARHPTVHPPSSETGGTRQGRMHTKGPWRWADVSDGDPKLIQGEVDRLGRYVLRPCGTIGTLHVRDDDACMMVPLTPDHPDARLIASAPALLEALEECVSFWAAMDVTDSYCELCDRHARKNAYGAIVGYISHRDDCVYARARAAIAAATTEGE